MKQYITSFCAVESGRIIVNNETVYHGESAENPVDFLKSAYKHFKINYPKFYKMDNLSKLAFIASELLLQANPLKGKYEEEDCAIIICNSSSSLDIDAEHQATISDKHNYFPSPAVFVYTLPNILIGEIAIRNSIKGENSLFIFEGYNIDFMVNYIEGLFKQKKIKACMTGYVDYFENNYRAFLYTVENLPGRLQTEHTTSHINQLFNK